MARTAGEYIQMVVNPKYWPSAKVIAANKKGTHVIILPHQEMIPDDEENTIFIRVDDTA